MSNMRREDLGSPKSVRGRFKAWGQQEAAGVDLTAGPTKGSYSLEELVAMEPARGRPARKFSFEDLEAMAPALAPRARIGYARDRDAQARVHGMTTLFPTMGEQDRLDAAMSNPSRLLRIFHHPARVAGTAHMAAARSAATRYVAMVRTAQACAVQPAERRVGVRLTALPSR